MIKFDKNLLYLKLPPVVYAALILSLSAFSSTPAPDLGISWEDKIYHALEYFIFGLLVLRAFPRFHELPRRRPRTALLIALGFLYAAVDEIVQYFVPTRDSSLGDWSADACGYLLAALLVTWWRAKPRGLADSN